MKLRAINQGRLAIWWATHRQEAIRAMQLSAIVGLFLVASRMDYEDQLALERSLRERAEVAASVELYGPPIPPTVFVLEARTREELDLKIAEIAGSLDGWRAKNRGMK